MNDTWRVSGFTEVRPLGAGAQGRVVLARHETAGTPVAIKYLPPGGPGAPQEALMLASVDDPHVARLYQLVESPHGMAIVMEAVDGVSLKEILGRHGALGPEAALAVLKGSLLGLAAAHAVGVVHRDYKPANVVVQADGLSKLIDFGIAAPAGRGSAAGTPRYMAPEQWRGEPAGPATDVYAATCVFFECATGGPPYPETERAPLMAQHLTAPPPVERVPEPLRPLLAHGLAKRAADRPAGAAEFVVELEATAAAAYGPDWEARGVRALAGAAVALAMLFPLGALAAPGTAVAAGGGVAGAAGGGALGAAATKVTLAVAATAVVTAGGAGVYAVQQGEPEPAPWRPVSLSIGTASRPGEEFQFVTVGGHRDPAVQRRINAVLRAPADRLTRSFRTGAAFPVGTTATVTMHGSELLSVRYDVSPRPEPGMEGNWVKNFYAVRTVVVDLVTGRALGPRELFRPAVLTDAGAGALLDRLRRLSANGCLSETGGLQARLTPRDLTREDAPVQVMLAPGHMDFFVDIRTLGGDVSEACRSETIEMPYARLADLVIPRLAEQAAGARPVPTPVPS
ncbi:serine/threonine protein kinase [Actinomadura craniellae]|uniref:non-specific serine/threonine protein kinase n=1 Tax=Actinomadura craniellae TaxID=2231787 RepID=A0A365H2N9_9ACTN|nr:serine/threonine-protein kinase [Actinomadura craniellae]RAY13286.1 serine/threonine protein kinase [Actinomadura craniellae]